MKKLMIAAAIVCAAAFVQAGSVTWNLYDVSDPSTGYAYLFNSETVSVASFDAIKEAILGGTFSSAYAAKASCQLSFDESIEKNKAIDDVSGEMTLWMVALDDKDNPTLAFVGEEIEQSIGGSGSKSYTWTYSVNTGEWQAIPEPFSGTLALLGMGVVALRRKMKKAKKA